MTDTPNWAGSRTWKGKPNPFCEDCQHSYSICEKEGCECLRFSTELYLRVVEVPGKMPRVSVRGRKVRP